jgi:hypothetical protein
VSSGNVTTTPKAAVHSQNAVEPTCDISANGVKTAAVGRGQLVDAAVLAGFLGVSRDFVYSHADELGAVRLGAGARPRLRFNRDLALERLNACSVGRQSEDAPARTVEPKQPRRRRASLGSGVDLLPIRGSRAPGWRHESV